jgi:hypothetical protein
VFDLMGADPRLEDARWLLEPNPFLWILSFSPVRGQTSGGRR